MNRNEIVRHYERVKFFLKFIPCFTIIIGIGLAIIYDIVYEISLILILIAYWTIFKAIQPANNLQIFMRFSDRFFHH